MADLEQTISVGDLVKFIAAGDGNTDNGGPALGSLGKVISISGKAAYGSICVKLDKVGHYDEWWTVPSKLEVLGHDHDFSDVKADEPDEVPAKPAWDLSLITASLSGSGVKYARGHVRLESQGIRLQGQALTTGNKWEDSYSSISDGLRAYIKKLPLDCPSVANTGTMYARCMMRRDGSMPYGVRVQIPGPAFNREWGAEFVIAHLACAPKLPAGLPDDATACQKDTTSPATSPTCEHGFVSVEGMAACPDCPCPWPHEPAGQPLAVGDKVVLVKDGDADGCKHGPKVGSTGVVHALTEAGCVCGTFTVKVDKGWGGTYWTATADHWAKLLSPVKPKEPTSPSAFASSSKGIDSTCVNCGHSAGKHYSGGHKASGEHFAPPLCPDPHAVCPVCGPCGPQPMAIHTLDGVCKGNPSAYKPSPGVGGLLLNGSTCANCSHAKSAHYPGGHKSSFDPPLCPNWKATCPSHGIVGPTPLAIHAISCTDVPMVPSTGVPF
jgi:hypothetical protein